MNEVLLGFVDGFVQRHVAKVKLWHFLRERSLVTDEPEIRLRFFGDEKQIRCIEEDLNVDLARLERDSPELYSSHLFGKHGKPGRYEGEQSDYGARGWNIFVDFLMKTSEVSIRFLREEPLGNSEKPWTFYVERFSHCFWNQIGARGYILFRAVGPEVVQGIFQWTDFIAQATGLPS